MKVGMNLGKGIHVLLKCTTQAASKKEKNLEPSLGIIGYTINHSYES
jgi:hypothetical protein